MAPFHCITSTDAAILINMYERLVQIVSSTVSTLLINSPSVLIIVKLIDQYVTDGNTTANNHADESWWREEEEGGGGRGVGKEGGAFDPRYGRKSKKHTHTHTRARAGG